MLRLQCKSASGELAGFVTVMGNQGTVYMEPFTPYSAFVADMDKAMEEGAKSIRQALVFVRTKEGELAKLGGKAAAPVAEARAALSKCKAAVSSHLSGVDSLKKKVQTAKGEFIKKEEAEKNAHIEARERKEAAAITGEASAKMEAVEACVKRLAERVKPLTSLEGAEVEAFASPVSLLEEAEGLLKEALEAVAAVKACTKEQQAKVAKATKGPLAEVRKELHKMDAKAAASAAACKTSADSVRDKCASIVRATFGRVATALRSEAERRGIALDALFLELAGSAEGRISEEAFCSHVASLEGFDVSAEHVKLVFRNVEKGGVGRRKFLGFVQQYFTVVRSIAITSDFDVGKAKTVRKAEPDEIIEVLEGPRTDPKLGLTRVRGRSLADLAEGWVSVAGNQGTPFLQEAQKPFYYCAGEAELRSAFARGDGPEPIRACRPDEVLELLEGPRSEAFEPALRVRGKACSDGAVGWLTVRDKTGAVVAAKDENLYTCAQSVAITDGQDIKDCKVVRKLAVGESFTVLEGPTQEGGITRVRAKALKDDQEGWVTTKGNAGTVYASSSSKHYCLAQGTPLQKRLSSASESVRELAGGEMVQALEEPKEEACPPEARVRCRALSDGAVGWAALRGDNLRRWSPRYKCARATPIHDALAAEGAGAVRQLEVGEKAELLEGPTEDGGVLRMRARAEKDGATGWVTVRDGEGRRLLEPMA
mmetsp:Transcript_99440/g.309818  ORF Transcript_99440/g.309818 Transcript_99440/m.309818 type:complete len:710 (-) Transcript_99440:118-2247(-)